MNAEYAARRAEFIKSNREHWRSALMQIFPLGIPERCQWSSLGAIISIFNVLGSTPDLNYLFLPDGGGSTLRRARASVEPDCIEFDTSGAYVVRPKALSFESFGDNLLEWAYFRLDTGGLKNTGIYGAQLIQRESVCELTPGRYVEHSAIGAGYYGYDEGGSPMELPRGARSVTRYLEGSFVVFAKSSTYNADTTTVDGRHAMVTAERFREYIRRNAEKCNEGAPRS